VNNGETVVIGGLISESFTDSVSGVPYLKDIPYLGWLFKTKSETLRKINLLIFLTPHIVRTAEDLEQLTIRKRLELEDSIGDEDDFAELAHYEQAGVKVGFSVAQELSNHAARYPIERMRELERQRADTKLSRVQADEEKASAEMQRYAVVVATFLDETQATNTLTTLLDAGYDGTLVSSDSEGRLLFKIEIGPFDNLWEAERAATTLDTAYGYSSSVTALRQSEP